VSGSGELSGTPHDEPIPPRLARTAVDGIRSPTTHCVRYAVCDQLGCKTGAGHTLEQGVDRGDVLGGGGQGGGGDGGVEPSEQLAGGGDRAARRAADDGDDPAHGR